MLLQFTQPPIAEERPLLERFSTIGIGPGRPWDAACVDASTLSAIDAGVAEAQALIQAGIDRTVSSNGLFGTRAELGGDSMKRTLGARIGIYGNSVEEAWYGGFSASGDRPIRLRFPPDGLPPAAYFWSMTLYTMPDRLLYANDQDRYSIGSETEGWSAIPMAG